MGEPNRHRQISRTPTNEEFAAVAKRSYGRAGENAIRAATGTPRQAELSESGYGFLLRKLGRLFHGFAHLASAIYSAIPKTAHFRSTHSCNRCCR